MTEFHKRSNSSRKNTAKRIAAHFEKRRSPEDNRRLKQSSRRRKADQEERRPRRRHWDDDEDVVAFEKIKKSPQGHPRPAPDPGPEAPPDPPPGALPADPDAAWPSAGPGALVIATDRGRATVARGDEILVASLAEDIAARQQSALAVGDRVALETRAGHARVVAVQPRRSELSRPDPGQPHRRRVLAANVDLAVLVLSVRRPALKPGLVDRFLLALEHGGARPVVVANKVDLVPDARERGAILAHLSPHAKLGVPCVAASAETGEGLDELAALVGAVTSVFVGHSGVGKSSLLNALDPDGARATGRGRHGDGKGRHTTTRSSLTPLPGGGLVIDTPGVRAFGLWNLDPRELAGAFPELARHAPRCRFRDCSHLVEPGCAVLRALDEGDVPRSRYASYVRIRASLDT